MKYRGADFLVQVLADDNVTWLSATSDRSTSLSIGNEYVDTTAKGSSGQWRESTVAAGVRSSEISCAGLVVDGNGAYSKFMSRVFDGAVIHVRVIHATAQDVIIDGRFIVSSCERSGEYNGAEQYTVSMASAVTLVVSTPVATPVASISSGFPPLAVAFSATIVGGTAPYTYDWDFGDSTSHSALAAPTHTYTSTGTYVVTLTVTDAVGSVSVATTSIVVAGTAGAASTEWNLVEVPPTVPRPKSVAFTTRTNMS